MNKKRLDSVVKIFVVKHKDYWQPSGNSIFQVIGVGGYGSSNSSDEILTDNYGDNISEKNPNYSELTAMYWIWKNYPLPDYVGFCHYRRYLAFDAWKRLWSFDRKKHGTIKMKLPQNKNIGRIIGNDMSIMTTVRSSDIILPESIPLKMTIELHYKKKHIAKDWSVLKSVLKQKFPTDYAVAEKVFQRNHGHLFNMFIMRNDLFRKYMKWLFSILTEVNSQLAPSEDPYQRRVCGFMAERLLNVFIEAEKEHNGKLKILEVPTLLIKEERQVPNSRL